MEHYDKGAVLEVDDPDGPFVQLGFKFGEVTTMKVKHGSKIKNLLSFAMKKMKADETRCIIFAGMGLAVTKTISCVEIMKRQIKNLHQINKAYFRRTEEYWEPKQEGLDRLKVNRQVPALAVLLSKDPLDKNELGYQAPGSYEAVWTEAARQDKKRKATQKQAAKYKDHSKLAKQRQEQKHDGQGSMTSRKRRNKKWKQQTEQRTDSAQSRTDEAQRKSQSDEKKMETD